MIYCYTHRTVPNSALIREFPLQERRITTGIHNWAMDQLQWKIKCLPDCNDPRIFVNLVGGLHQWNEVALKNSTKDSSM